MTDSAIKKALEVAAREICPMQGCTGYVAVCGDCNPQAAVAVAAFLNAPPPTVETIKLNLGEVSAQGRRDIYAYPTWLAAMVSK